jgi:hypothetical protein
MNFSDHVYFVEGGAEPVFIRIWLSNGLRTLVIIRRVLVSPCRAMYNTKTNVPIFLRKACPST